MSLRKRGFSGTKDNRVTETELAHRQIALEAAQESMVLLKNEEALLPLASGKKLAVFGGGAQRTIKGGTGSGDVNERSSVSVRAGLEQSGLLVTSQSWLEDYEKTFVQARLDWKDLLERLEQENTDPNRGFFDIYAENAFRVPAGREITEADVAEADTDTALYVLSRVAGEGADRFAEAGDYYLTDEEEDQIIYLCDHFENVILVLNTGAQVDLSWVLDCPQIKSIIYMGQAGMEGGNALANLITGKVTPSGKLADSWAYRYEDYPCAETFSHNKGDSRDEEYNEGLYVGYRYFQSFGVDVQYPFGFGLSYTDFSLENAVFTYDEEKQEAVVNVDVKNEGDTFSGKEVVQVYVSQQQNGMPKPLRILAGFAKTGLLAPGAVETVTVTIPVKMLATYDEEGSRWILEKGKFGLWIGNSSESVDLIGALEAEKTDLIEQCTEVCPLQRPLMELVVSDEYAIEFEEEWQELLTISGLPVIAVSAKEQKFSVPADEMPEMRARDMVDRVSAKDMLSMLYGEISRGHDNATLVALGSAGKAVPGAAGETSSVFVDRLGIPGLPMADGPAGLRLTQSYEVNPETEQIYPRNFFDSMEQGLFSKAEKHEGADVYYQYCTAIPTGMLLAMSFDTALIRRVGHMIGEEMEQFHITWWLAPGMNIHRDPLCGRNFEYYSEDPLVAGMIAAAMTNGVQEIPGVGTTLKHFACNNQEDDRKQSDSIVSERTLRELYLRSFEIAVKTSQPMAVMTSYNKVNGVHSANNYDLCTKVLREEWGFAGIVMTDWTTTDKVGESVPHLCAMAGNDLIMPGAQSDVEELLNALESGELPTEVVRTSAARIIAMALRSNCCEGAVPYKR